MLRLALIASLLAVAACSDPDTVQMDRPNIQREPAPQAVPSAAIPRQPLSAPPSSLTGAPDPAAQPEQQKKPQ